MFRKGGVARIARGPIALYARFVILDSSEKPQLSKNCLMLINTILIQRTIRLPFPEQTHSRAAAWIPIDVSARIQALMRVGNSGHISDDWWSSGVAEK